MNKTTELIQATPLKKLDSSMLTITLLTESSESGIDNDKVFSAISLASHLHAGQTRANHGNLPRTPYIEHPLRNAIRILRWGCKNQDVVLAAILHDVVEDCSPKFAKEYGYPEAAENENKARLALLNHITRECGEEVARIVLAVSNEYIPNEISRLISKADKRETYFLHVKKAIHNDPNVLLVKFSDFVDNATGLYHNDIEKNRERIANMARKYFPLIALFSKEIKDNAEAMSLGGEHVKNMLDHLAATKNRLNAIIQKSEE